jgi:hypothetical protein
LSPTALSTAVQAQVPALVLAVEVETQVVRRILALLAVQLDVQAKAGAFPPVPPLWEVALFAALARPDPGMPVPGSLIVPVDQVLRPPMKEAGCSAATPAGS